MKKSLLFVFIAIAFFLCCTNTSSIAQGGSLIGPRACMNIRNKYDSGEIKKDWTGFELQKGSSIVESLKALDERLKEKIGSYRIGFSPNMAADPADLAQWIDSVKQITGMGKKVLVCLWPLGAGSGGDISQPDRDIENWKKVIKAFSDNNMLGDIVGWELINEPEGSGKSCSEYYQKVWKGVGGMDNIEYDNLTPEQIDDISKAWQNKPILLEGLSYGRKIDANLANGTKLIKNHVFAFHFYPYYIGIDEDKYPERVSWTVEQWYDKYLATMKDHFSLADGNFIITEAADQHMDWDVVQAGGDGGEYTSHKNRYAAGFLLALRELLGKTNTSFYWYVAYHGADVGCGESYSKNFREGPLGTANFVLFGFDNYSDKLPDGLSNVALGKPATTSSIYKEGTSYVPAKITDGIISNASRWLSSNSGSFPHSIEIDLKDEYILNGFTFYTGYDGFNSPIMKFQFQKWNGSAWVDILSDSLNTNPKRTYVFDPVKASKVKLLATQGTDDLLRLYELKVYGKEIVAPVAPSNLQATINGGNNIELSWQDNSDNEDGFYVERKKGENGQFETIGTSGPNTTTYTDSTYPEIDTYYYRVQAFNSKSSSDYSNEVSATPTVTSEGVVAPSNLKASVNGENNIELSWQDNSDNEDGFYVERKKGENGQFETIGTLAPNITTYTDSAYPEAGTYYYRARAFNSKNSSDYSNEVSATPANTSTITGTSASPAYGYKLETYPNPTFGPSSFLYTLAAPTKVQIDIYDAIGQKIVNLANCFQTNGTHIAKWDGYDSKGNTVKQGIYYYVIKTDNALHSKKILLINKQ